jgi:hypothetical protein
LQAQPSLAVAETPPGVSAFHRLSAKVAVELNFDAADAGPRRIGYRPSAFSNQLKLLLARMIAER